MNTETRIKLDGDPITVGGEGFLLAGGYAAGFGMFDYMTVTCYSAGSGNGHPDTETINYCHDEH